MNSFVGLALTWGNSVLLQHRDSSHGLRDADLWVLPGGTVEDMESLENAVRREFLEETGYVLDAPQLVAMYVDQRRRPLDDHQIWFYREAYDGYSQISCFEGQAMEFVPLTAIKFLKRPKYLDSILSLLLIDQEDRDEQPSST